jgi:glycosyltransferase involved in cell wall biosynthesis
MRILLYTDLRILPKELFWHRDLGLLTKAFRKLGHKAWLVVHPATKPTRNPKTATRNGPVIWASPSDVRNPSWWKSHKPDLVILGLWTRPKYDPIRRAALAATSRVMERADSDGMRTASCGLRLYIRRRHDCWMDRCAGWPHGFQELASWLYAGLSVLGTPWIEGRLRRTLGMVPALLVETGLATKRWKELTRRLGKNPGKIHHVPHPVQTSIFRKFPAGRKANRIVSVGRWESYQKNLPLLCRTLVSFLKTHRSWSAELVGTGLPAKSPHPRLRFSPPMTSRKLRRRYLQARVFLSGSRYESFGLAAAEASLCGCEVISLVPDALPAEWQTRAGKKAPLSRLHEIARAPRTARPPTSHRHDFLSPSHVAGQILRIARQFSPKSANKPFSPHE